jgi:hypothetical protein
MKRGFLTNITYKNVLWMTGLVLLVAAAVVNHLYVFSPESIVQNNVFKAINESVLLRFNITNPLRGNVVDHLFQFLYLMGAGFLLQYISSEFRLIRVRSFFPIFLFCVLAAAFLPVIPLNGAALSCLLFCLVCLSLFRSLESGLESRGAFNASVLLALAALFQSRLLYLMPSIWMVMSILQVLNYRSFLASLLGLISIAWIVSGLCFLTGEYGFIKIFFTDLTAFRVIDFSELSKAEIAYALFLVVLIISALVSFWPKQHLDKLRTRNYLNSILLLWFSLFILWLFSAKDLGYVLPLLSLTALFIAHFFSLVDNLYSRFMFFALIGLSTCVFFMF